MFTRKSVLALGLTSLCLSSVSGFDAKGTKHVEEHVRQLMKTRSLADMSADNLMASTDQMGDQIGAQIASVMQASMAECSPELLAPALFDCSDPASPLTYYLESVAYNACMMSLNETNMEWSEVLTAPAIEVATCFTTAGDTVESPFCVQRFEDGNYEGFIGEIPDFGNFTGGTNQVRFLWRRSLDSLLTP